jgi:glycosyltransferase involved in cell wall biosynthesis
VSIASDVESAQRPTVSVVIPVYYNEESLGELADELAIVESRLADLGAGLELIFVDDGSRDASLARLLEIKRKRPATKIVKLTRNFGATQASRTGFRFVSGDCFLTLAADLQDPPDLIVEAYRRWSGGAKYVICSRTRRADGLMAGLFAGVFYRLLRMFVVRDYPRRGYDVALMDKQMLPFIRDSAKNIHTPLYAYWLGFEPSVFEYTRLGRRHGRSRWTFRKRLTLLIDSLLGFSVVPIRIISLVGLIIALSSATYGVSVVISALAGNREVPGFATLAVLLTFLASLILLTLGVIAEYVWRIHDEVSRKPESVIDEVF